MKSHNPNQSESFPKGARILALSVAVACLAGCASTPYKKGDAAAISLQDAASAVQGESRSLEVAMGTLDDLVNKPEPDLKPQFKRFSKALHNLAASSRHNERAQARVAQKTTIYFDEWNKQLATMNYEVVRARSEARKADVTNHLDSVTRRYHESQDAMLPLLNYLYDVRKALDADLTQSGIDSIKPIVAKARENADKVQLALGRLTSELTSSSANMSSVVYQNVSLSTNQPPQRIPK
jgi:Protein of unknown function (DUF2959)